MTTSKGELSALLRALADGIDRFSPDWGLENNQEWEALSAEKKRAREIADEIDNVLTRGDGALITPYDATVENIRESLELIALRLHGLERQNAKLWRVREAAALLLITQVPAGWLSAAEWRSTALCFRHLAAALEALEALEADD